MAKSIRHISDIPNFDTYPSAPPDRQTGRTGAERSSVERSSIERSSLEQRAAELGAAAGKIAFIVRQTKERVEKLTNRPIHDRVSGLAESTMARAEHLRRLAAARAQEWTHAAQDKRGRAPAARPLSARPSPVTSGRAIGPARPYANTRCKRPWPRGPWGFWWVSG